VKSKRTIQRSAHRKRKREKDGKEAEEADGKDNEDNEDKDKNEDEGRGVAMCACRCCNSLYALLFSSTVVDASSLLSRAQYREKQDRCVKSSMPAMHRPITQIRCCVSFVHLFHILFPIIRPRCIQIQSTHGLVQIVHIL
jgi:hypothetical protein